MEIVVVGASLAGMHAAETLRADGFDGAITVVGDEHHVPYDRPPLSKQILTGAWDADRIRLAAATNDDLDLTWEQGVAAAGLDLGSRRVHLADGRELPYDGLVLATGARARTLAGTGLLDGVLALRTIDDATDLVARIDAGAERIVVVGAGFIGAEVAASCRERGLSVDMVEPQSGPMAGVLGDDMAAAIADLHAEHGVELHLGVGVEAVEGDGRVERVRLSDGTVLPADVVVVGIGVIPNTGWLEGSGLSLDNGVVCDATTLAAPGVVAAGDVARWPNPLYGGELMRVEHWEHAVVMGAHAGRRLLVGDGDAAPFATVPWFWSDQYDRKIQLAGRVRPTDQLAVVAGAVADRRFCALYGRDGKVSGVLAMNMPAKVVRYRRRLAEPGGVAWDDALADEAAAER